MRALMIPHAEPRNARDTTMPPDAKHLDTPTRTRTARPAHTTELEAEAPPLVAPIAVACE